MKSKFFDWNSINQYESGIWEKQSGLQVVQFMFSPYSTPENNRELADRLIKCYEEYLAKLNRN